MPVARKRIRLPAAPPPCPPGAHRMEIDLWRPSALNEFADRHWSVRKRAKDGDKAIVALYAQVQGIPRAAGRRRVTLWVGLAKGRRRHDPDAFWKSLLDALTAAGLLVDDGPEWCELAPVQYGRPPEPFTAITLEDIP